LKIFDSISKITPLKNAVVTQGTFDGVHLGHQKILTNLKYEANKIDGETVIITFFPHPRVLVNQGDKNLKLLSTLSEKILYLEKLGIDNVIVIPFDEELSNLQPEEYIKKLIVDKIAAKKMVIGYDHRFGKDRKGGIDDLISFGLKYNFEVQQIAVEMITEIKISSTKIRKAISLGNIIEANALLGYSYQFTGTVVHGLELGRKIGYRTANIVLEDAQKQLPLSGVFAAFAYVDAKRYGGMLSIGKNPTIAEKGESIEMHLFDFDKDIYGKKITVEMVKKIRDEKKFEHISDLSNQLYEDKLVSKYLLLEK